MQWWKENQQVETDKQCESGDRRECWVKMGRIYAMKTFKKKYKIYHIQVQNQFQLNTEFL